jgi:hypothetical protein
MLLGGDGLPTLRTDVRVLHTQSALYLGAQLHDDKPSEIVANVRDRDGKVYEDDSLEVFMDTEGARRSSAHLVVNSLGARYDEIDHDVAENFEWSAVAAVNESGWAVEIELPFDQGVPPSVGEVWNLAVCRTEVRLGEMSTWGRHQRGFNEPDAFGELVFGSTVPSAQVEDLGERLLGDGLALLSVTNPCIASSAVKLNVAIVGADRRSGYYGAVKKELLPGAHDQVYVPYKVRRCGPALLTFSLTDDRAKVIWRSGAYPIGLPAVSDALEAGMHALAAAWKNWASVPPGEVSDALNAELTALQKEWGYIDSQMQSANGTPLPQLEAMFAEADRLQARAEALKERVEQVGGTP